MKIYNNCPHSGQIIQVFWVHRNQELSEVIDVEEPSSLWQSSFDPRRPTRFVAHGWKSSSESDVIQLIKSGTALLEKLWKFIKVFKTIRNK